MPTVGSITLSAYREESPQTDKLIADLCDAQMMFLPVTLDKEGIRNGQTYRYASIESIRRSTQAALAMKGIITPHIYGYGESGEYVTTTLRHVSGQYIASTSPIPRSPDPRELKSNKTTLCRTHLEGLLGIVTEEDDDSQSVTVPAYDDRTLRDMANARAKIMQATTRDEVAAVLDRAAKFIGQGKLPEEFMSELRPMAELKANTLDGGAAVSNEEELQNA